MRLLGIIVSRITFALSIVVHLSTFVPGWAISMAIAVPLHLLAMFSFFLMVISLVPLLRASPQSESEGAWSYFWRSHAESQAANQKLITLAPTWMKIIGGLLIAYTVLNFVLFAFNTEGGTPSAENGSYRLHAHGKTIRDLTKQEYEKMGAFISRGFSGCWLLFSFLPLAYFSCVQPKLVADKKSRSVSMSIE